MPEIKEKIGVINSDIESSISGARVAKAFANEDYETEKFMKCPSCASDNIKVVDSRPVDENNSIRRRRECLDCQTRFTTYEIIENVPIVVVKKDKNREVFDRSKLIKGMLTACEKRPVSIETIERAVDEIETTLQNSLDREVTSVHIGELVMEKLKNTCHYAKRIVR